jgi:hypothetical protein
VWVKLAGWAICCSGEEWLALMEKIVLYRYILMPNQPFIQQDILKGDRNIVSQSQVNVQNAIAVPEILALITQIKQQIEVEQRSPDLKTQALKRLDAATD